MIEIEIKGAKNRIRQILVTGHGGDKKGKDIVCAAVSAITQAALSGLLHYGANAVEWEMRPGYLLMNIKESIGKKMQSVFSVIINTMILGLEGIARENPERIKFKIES